jgi:hypothetical protein
MLTGTQLTPFAVDAVNTMDKRIGQQHIPRFFIEKNINFSLRPRLMQRGYHGRSEQHVAMMAQFYD